MGSIFSTRKPNCWPSVRSSVKLPDRLRPNRKSAPTQTSATRSQSTSTLRTKASGSHCDSSSVKRTIASPWTPARSRATRFWSGVISSGGALSGLNTRGGCGSKVSTTDVPRALGGAPADALDDLQVPAVEAVEIADGQYRIRPPHRPWHRPGSGSRPPQATSTASCRPSWARAIPCGSDRLVIACDRSWHTCVKNVRRGREPFGHRDRLGQ